MTIHRKLHYPKIRDSRDFPLARCVAFEKIDGTNLHFDWQRTRGWVSMGTRRDSFSLDAAGQEAFRAKHLHLEDAARVFANGLCEPLTKMLQSDDRFQDCSEVTIFAEYVGPGSFAGLHKASDEKRLVLFDVQADGQMLDPFEFVELFCELPIARVVYVGKFHGNFTEAVRQGKYNVCEGVVCKTGTRGNVQMCKIKTNAYQAQLKQAFGQRWEDHWE